MSNFVINEEIKRHIANILSHAIGIDNRIDDSSIVAGLKVLGIAVEEWMVKHYVRQIRIDGTLSCLLTIRGKYFIANSLDEVGRYLTAVKIGIDRNNETNRYLEQARDIVKKQAEEKFSKRPKQAELF